MSRINEALRRRSQPEPPAAPLDGPHDVDLAADADGDSNAAGCVLDRFVPESTTADASGTVAHSITPGFDASPVPIETRVEPGSERRVEAFPELALDHPAAATMRPVATKVEVQSRTTVVATHSASPAAILQYRRLAGALTKWQKQGGGKTLLVTSAREGDGKTLTAVNLALTFSESFGRRVLLVDADQLRPSLHETFSLPNTAGLSDVLRSAAPDVPITPVSETLGVLSAGTPAADSAAFLTSYRMEQLLEQLALSVDWVVLDAGVVESIRDPQRLARMVGGVLFVIRAKSTPNALVTRALAQLPRERIVGTVLNGVAPTNDVPCVAR